MGHDQIVNTISDMEKLYYSRRGQDFLKSDDLLSPFVMKDAAVTSGTTGVYNAVYGQQAWVQLNMEANTFGSLPKVPWGRSGHRLITVRAGTMGSGGQSETATLPATVKPTFVEADFKPKLVASNFENSEVQEFLASQGGDDSFASMADLRTYMGVQHKEEMNYELNIENGTVASNNMESVDRVVGSYAELNNCSESDESTGYTAGDMDPYGAAATSAWNDRDAGANVAVDAYVSHNSSTVRTFTDAVLQGVLQQTLEAGANPNGQHIQTGYDTWAQFNQLYDPQVRYNLMGEATIQPGVNGIKTLEGRNVGMQVATWGSPKKPIIVSKDTVQDTGGISRVYFLDTSNPEGYDLPRLSLKIAKPTQYFEAGINQGTPMAINKFGTEGMYRTMGEISCTFFGAQGKARDLKA